MTTIYLDDRRREAAQLPTKLQHAIAGIPLLLSGIQNINEGSEISMAVAEIAIAVVVLVAFIKEIRSLRARSHGHHHSHPAYGWFDLAAGVLLIFEAFHGPHHKAAYFRPQFLSGVVTIGLGLFHSKLHAFHQRKRYLRLDEAGLEYRLNPIRKFSIPLNDLASIDIGEKNAVFHRKDGKRHTVSFTRLRNSEAVRQALAEYSDNLQPAKSSV